MFSIIGFLKRTFDIRNSKCGTIHNFLHIQQIALFFLAFFSSAFWITPAAAAFSIEYQAPTDPTTQGFSPLVVYPPAPQVIEPIANDLGYPAWSISGLALPSQFFYQSGALNTAQKADINSQGFTLTLRGRVLQGSAPAFDAGSGSGQATIVAAPEADAPYQVMGHRCVWSAASSHRTTSVRWLRSPSRR